MVTLETPLRVVNVLTETSQKTSRDGVFVARTLVRARPRVPFRILNVTKRDQVLGESSIIGQGETESGPLLSMTIRISHDGSRRSEND